MEKKEIILILHNIRSAYNVGSIFRTADAAGVSKIFLCGITPRPSVFMKTKKQAFLGAASKISKTALGAEKFIQWEYRSQTWRCLKEVKNKNPKVKVVGLEQSKRSEDIFKFKPKFPLALVVGHERKGLSQKIFKYLDHLIEIPMYGKKESLNVSVAVGVALYKLIDG